MEKKKKGALTVSEPPVNATAATFLPISSICVRVVISGSAPVLSIQLDAKDEVICPECCQSLE